jgi:heterodisulfide reductase subunit B
MKIAYYPGCTLKNAAKNFEDSAVASLKELGYELKELPRWTCCGTVYSLTDDDLIHQLAPVRNLLRAKENGFSRLTTLCAMCYNTLKRADLLLQEDKEKESKINAFMYEEETDYYGGDVTIIHPLEIIRDELGYEALRQKVTRPLTGLRVAPYYGCMLVRPPEIGLDDREHPTVLHDLARALGAEVIEDPYDTECCGSYETVNRPDAVVERTRRIMGSAVKRGAELLFTSCPLCNFNLDQRQAEVSRAYPDFRGLPVLYFTQLMALALGHDDTVCRFDLHYVDPRPVLATHHLLEEPSPVGVA